MNQMEPIFFTPPKASADRRRVLHKGGGGGSAPDYEAERVAARNAQREAFYKGTGYYDGRDARKAQISKMKDDIVASNRAKLDDEYNKASKNLNFNMARSGLDTSTQSSYELGELKKLYDRQIADIGSAAETAGSQAELGYENAISSGVGSINSGAQAANEIAMAMSKFSSSLQQALEGAKGASYGGAFASLGSTLEQNQFANSAAQGFKGFGKQDPKQVAPVGSTSSSGTQF